MKRLVLMLSAWCILFAMVLGAMITVGKGLGPHNAIQIFFDPGGCEMPCWRGLRPGISTFTQMQAAMEKMPDLVLRPVESVQSLDNSVDKTLCGITLSEPKLTICARQSGNDMDTSLLFVSNTLPLIDLWPYLGIPRVYHNCAYVYGLWTTYLYFSSGVTIAFHTGMPRESITGDIFPHKEPSAVHITELNYSAPTRSAANDPGARNWVGLKREIYGDTCQE